MRAGSMAQAAVQESLSKMAIESRRKPGEVRPIGDQVMVLADSPSAMTRSGLHIPEIARRHVTHLRTGVVVAVGLGDMLADGVRGPMDIAVGEHVIYDQASNRVVILDGQEYLILHQEQHIVAILDEPLIFTNPRCSWCGRPSPVPTGGELIICPDCGTVGIIYG